MPWPWESDFWRANAPPPDAGAVGTSREPGWLIDAAFADRRGVVHCFRRGRVISAQLSIGMSGRTGRSVDAVERLSAQLADDGETGSALLAVVTGRTPALSWSKWRPQEEVFPGVEWPRLDAAFLLDRDIAYMFFGSEFLAYDLAASRVRPGYPRAIAGQWHGLWEDGVDAAVNPGRGKVYFFKDGACSRYDVEHQRVEKGFPRTVGEVFPGLSWRRVDLAFCPGRAGELVFVREREAMVYRDSEAARQLALAESEARARVEAVLGGEMSELAESLHQAWRDDRSRGVTRADGTDSLIADIRRHAELASLAASFAATAARISEDAIGRLGADDVASFASPERWDEREEFARAPESELSIVEYPSPSDSGAARIVELEPSIASEALDEVELDVEIEVDLDGLEDLDEEPAPPGPRRPPPPPRTSE